MNVIPTRQDNTQPMVLTREDVETHTPLCDRVGDSTLHVHLGPPFNFLLWEMKVQEVWQVVPVPPFNQMCVQFQTKDENPTGVITDLQFSNSSREADVHSDVLMALQRAVVCLTPGSRTPRDWADGDCFTDRIKLILRNPSEPTWQFTINNLDVTLPCSRMYKESHPPSKP